MGPTTEPFHLPGRVDGRLLVSLSTRVLLSFVSLKFPLEPPDPDTPHPHHLSCSAVVNHRITSAGVPEPLSAASAMLGLVQLQNPDDCVESSPKPSPLVFICTKQDAVQLLRAARLHLTCLRLLS